MTVNNINVTSAIEKIRNLLKSNQKISPALVAAIELLITVITILLNQKNLNSRNSSIPPSKDSNRRHKTRKSKGVKKPGGQPGHQGITLKPVKQPDKIEPIFIDRKTLPPGDYTQVSFEKRQVFDINVSVNVIEYQAEILEDQHGQQWVAEFPEGVNCPAQYGNEVKSQSVYMSQYQLIPQLRVAGYFNDQLGLPISKSTIHNFNKAAYEKLEYFEEWAKRKLLNAPLNHGDETGVNVNGKPFWFHLLSNAEVALYQVDKKRGSEAMDRMGILPNYTGILCHDHWKPYYKYNFLHSLCNAHHLRELERAYEQDGQKWAQQMQALLTEINDKVKKTKTNKLSEIKIKFYQKKYRAILSQGENECPANKSNGKRGRTKQSKSRNLLERLKDFEDDVLRFMKNPIVPFTNNTAENDIRMTKVQQKISGCFRSIEGAQIFCRIRSYLVTCRKNNVSPTDALRLLFQGTLPDFIT